MTTYHIADSDGRFTGQSFSHSNPTQRFIERNTPQGCICAEGVTDWESQRVDMKVWSQIEDRKQALLLASDPDNNPDDESIDSIRAEIDLLQRSLLADYQPPPPSDDHDWNPDRKRYQLKPEAAEAQRKRSAAESRIADLERQSLRPLRELRVAEVDGKARPEDAAAQLKQIEAEIEALRPDLGAGAQKLNADRG